MPVARAPRYPKLTMQNPNPASMPQHASTVMKPSFSPKPRRTRRRRTVQFEDPPPDGGEPDSPTPSPRSKRQGDVQARRFDPRNTESFS